MINMDTVSINSSLSHRWRFCSANEERPNHLVSVAGVFLFPELTYPLKNETFLFRPIACSLPLLIKPDAIA